jgi:hypothetical protein
MHPFDYRRATTISDAARAHPSTKFIAGGTNLVDLMKANVERPAHVVDINALPLGGAGHGPRPARRPTTCRSSKRRSTRSPTPRSRIFPRTLSARNSPRSASIPIWASCACEGW